MEGEKAVGEFKIHEYLNGVGVHSAVLSLDRLYPDTQRRYLPKPTDLTGTVSFIKFNDKCYAVTARHVVEYFEKLAEAEKQPLRYFCPVGKGLKIRGPFLIMPEDFSGHVPDVAITPVNEQHLNNIGKRPFVISEDDPEWPLAYAMATGFPTAEKEDLIDRAGGFQLKMPFVSAIAAGNGADGRHHTVNFYSELASFPSVTRLSGMSGGPAFWSDGERYGLVGFVRDAMEQEGGQVMADTPKVHFMIQRTDRQILVDWLGHVDSYWSRAREAQDKKESVFFQEVREQDERRREAFFARSRKGVAYRTWCERLAPGDRIPRKKVKNYQRPEWF